MKGLKKLSILGLGLALTASLAACSQSKSINQLDAIPVAEEETYPEVSYDEEYAKEDLRLANVVVDTTNAKTKFYLGDEFSSEGLIVKARYFKYENGTRVATIDVDIDNYSIDTSEVNMYVAGTYNVVIGFRKGAILKTRSYSITVKNNVYEGTPNITYLSGLDVSWSDAIQEDDYFCQTSDNVLTVYVNSEAGANDTLKSKITTAALNATVYATTNDASGNVASITPITKWNNKNYNPVIDCEDLDISKPGTYMVKLTLTRNITVDGESIPVPAKGFVLINVRDVIDDVSYAGYYDSEGNLVSNGIKDFAASIDKIDYSDLAFNVKYYSGDKIVRVGDMPELFDFSINNIPPYVLGQSDVTVKLTEANLSNVIPQASFKVNVVDSGKTFGVYNVRDVSDFSNVVSFDTETEKYTDVNVGADGVYMSEDERVFGANIAGHNSAATADGITFSYRVKITKNTGKVEFTPEKSGRAKLYFDFSATGESNVIVKNAKGETLKELSMLGNGGSKISGILEIDLVAEEKIIITTTAGTTYFYGIAAEYDKA